MGSPAQFEYAIIGGGIAGLTLAIALHHRGIRVKIYEQASQFGEIGAGVSFTPNALQAMKVCHPGIYEAFEQVCTRNIWPSKQKVWFDYYDGEAQGQLNKEPQPAFTINNELGQNGVHRAAFLDKLVKLVPSSIATFGKRLDQFEKTDQGRLKLFFVDGTTAEADAILACDGIKSRVRQLLFGIDHPCAMPTYTHKYAYRAIIPMDAAIAAIGEQQAQNACMHMGHGGHVLTFPVNHGKMVNVVAFHTTDTDWADPTKLTAPASRADALSDFAGFGDTVTKLLQLAESKLDTWAIFDLGQNPPPTYVKDRVCLVGDAAHATSPHHGAGAGFCIEDSAVLAELLSDEYASHSHQSIAVALAVYDRSRRRRGEWLVQSSRYIGDAYEYLASDTKSDHSKIEAEIIARNNAIAKVDVASMCRKARDDLNRSADRDRAKPAML